MKLWTAIGATLLAGAGGLAGCASYASVSDRMPIHQAHSSKSPDTYMACVAPKWSETSASAHILPDGDRRVLVVPIAGFAGDQVMMTLTVTPQADGSDIAMRTMPSVSTWQQQWDQAQACL